MNSSTAHNTQTSSEAKSRALEKTRQQTYTALCAVLRGRQRKNTMSLTAALRITCLRNIQLTRRALHPLQGHRQISATHTLGRLFRRLLNFVREQSSSTVQEVGLRENEKIRFIFKIKHFKIKYCIKEKGVPAKVAKL